jgi:hypothetical protein
MYPMLLPCIHYFDPYSLGRILSDSEGEEATLRRPVRSRTAASKIVDPSNTSVGVLTSHRDAAVAAHIAAAEAAKAAAIADAASGSLSAAVGTSGSRSVSPGKHNANDAALLSKSGSGSDPDDISAGKSRGKIKKTAKNFL